MAWDSLASVGSLWLTMLEFWLAAQTALRLIAGVQKAGLDVHDISLDGGRVDILGVQSAPQPTHIAVELAN